jgi:hypothetical protein
MKLLWIKSRKKRCPPILEGKSLAPSPGPVGSASSRRNSFQVGDKRDEAEGRLGRDGSDRESVDDDAHSDEGDDDDDEGDDDDDDDDVARDQRPSGARLPARSRGASGWEWTPDIVAAPAVAAVAVDCLARLGMDSAHTAGLVKVSCHGSCHDAAGFCPGVVSMY